MSRTKGARNVDRGMTNDEVIAELDRVIHELRRKLHVLEMTRKIFVEKKRKKEMPA